MARKPAAKKPPAVVPVDTITHGAASRKNIPTAETAAFGDGTIGVPHESLTVGRVGYDARRGAMP